MDKPVKLRILTDAGVRDLNVRWPSEEEWIERQRGRRVIVRDLGRGRTETDILGADEADTHLLEKISDETGFDGPSATMALNQLSQADVAGVEREGGSFVVTLRVAGDQELELRLKCPTAKQAMEHRRSFARPVDLPHGRQEIKLNLKGAADLFDSLGGERTISIIYKVQAVTAVIQELQEMLAGSEGDFTRGSRPQGTSGGLSGPSTPEAASA